MSSDLLVLAALAAICIILNPLFKQSKYFKRLNSPYIKFEEPKIPTVTQGATIKADNTKTIVLLTDQFLPTTFAGSEISSYETIKYMRLRGHKIIIYVANYKVSSYDEFPIYKYDAHNQLCKDRIIHSDIVLYQFGKNATDFQLIQERKKPVYIFIHLINYCDWILGHKTTFKTCVVYNSRYVQDTYPTIHDNMRMIPYVDTKTFTGLRNKTIQNDVVCLINCNKNKGSSQLYDIAEKMPNVQFLAVKGAYGEQDIRYPKPHNVVYLENQKDIYNVFNKVGILLMPSHIETWGRTAVEAMASGIPVIHSEAGGLVECVGGAGVLCQRDDIDAWCQAIRRILGDRAYRETLRQNGFRRVSDIEKEQIRGRRELVYKIENS